MACELCKTVECENKNSEGCKIRQAALQRSEEFMASAKEIHRVLGMAIEAGDVVGLVVAVLGPDNITRTLVPKGQDRLRYLGMLDLAHDTVNRALAPPDPTAVATKKGPQIIQ